MYDVVYVFRGILIGLMVSVPLGPMGVLIIQKTLNKGALAGFVAGMGAACADLFYAIVAAFGLGFVINTIKTHELILQLIGDDKSIEKAEAEIDKNGVLRERLEVE